MKNKDAIRRRMLYTGLALVASAGILAALWLTGQGPAGPARDAMPGMPEMEQTARPPAPVEQEETRVPVLAAEPGVITIPPQRLQSIGVTFEAARQRPLERVIRTVGRVEVDERRLARVNLKFEGWIEELRVSAVGDHVKKGQILFTIYSPELVATQEEYLLALQSVKQLGESEFPEVARGAKDLLEATRRRFELWDVPEYHLRELEETGKVLRTLPVHAPLTGTVIRMQARAGTYVTPGTELYLIADLSHIWILADIYEYELPLIKVGQGATVTLSYDPHTRLHGHASFIYPTLDPKTRTAKVRFEVDNPSEKLKPDMYANVELKIPLGTRLAIPRDAVIESGERQIIFLHHGGGRLEWRDVRLGVRAEDLVEVVEGLKEGEHIVTSANFLIDSESQLRAAVSGMGGMKH